MDYLMGAKLDGINERLEIIIGLLQKATTEDEEPKEPKEVSKEAKKGKPEKSEEGKKAEE